MQETIKEMYCLITPQGTVASRVIFNYEKELITFAENQLMMFWSDAKKEGWKTQKVAVDLTFVQ